MSSSAQAADSVRSRSHWPADLSLVVIALVWGATFVVVKQALTQITTMYFLCLRFTLGSACLALLFVPALRRAGASDLWRGLRGGGIAGLFLWTGYVLQSFGLKYTSAGNSGFLTGLYIVLVPVISAAFYSRWPQARELLGIGIATAGMIVMAVPNLDRHLRMNTGDLLTIGCAVAFACHLLVLGYFSQREFFPGVALGQVACTAALSGLSLLAERPHAVWNRSLVWAICVTGVLATALALTLQSWAQQYTTATRTALILTLEPVFALVVAALAGGERITLAAVSGGSLILAGIVAVELKPARGT